VTSRIFPWLIILAVRALQSGGRVTNPYTKRWQLLAHPGHETRIKGLTEKMPEALTLYQQVNKAPVARLPSLGSHSSLTSSYRGQEFADLSIGAPYWRAVLINGP